MLHGHPETPLLRTDRKRGFGFVALGNTHGKDMGFRVGISQQSESTPGDPH